VGSPTLRFAGTCHAFVAVEIGLSIDLSRAERELQGAGRARLPAARNPGGLDWTSPPLTLEQDGPTIDIAGHALRSVVQVRVFDFGAVSFGYRIDFNATVEGLIQLGATLSSHPALMQDARARARALIEALGSAVRRPALSAYAEDYIVFAVQGVHGSAAGVPDADLARILRAEPAELGEQEVRDSVSASVSYGPFDRAVIDWNAAMLIDAEPQASLDVLEFANVELLEYRALDAQLDAALEEAWATVSGRQGAAARYRTGHRELKRVAALQMDAALLYEEINNALKLLGDQFLARLYRATSRRMHLDEWERATLRKLETLESIYAKMADTQAHRRAELLEWIIIALISAEIVFSLVTFLRK
jgi:hypothetical protein